MKTNLRFQPDLAAHSQIIRISIHSGLFQPAKDNLDSLIETQKVPVLLDSVIRACRGKHSETPPVLGFVLECYSNKGLITEALEVFRRITADGHVPPLPACNALLDSLQRAHEIKLAWCVCGALIRIRVLPDYVRIAQILCKNGKLDRVVRLLDMGIVSNALVYKLVIDCYSERGNFSRAFHYLGEMCKTKNRNSDPGFATYISILDGACKYDNEEVFEAVLGSMVEKGLLPKLPSLLEYDSIIQKICNLGKTYGAQTLFKRARDVKIELQDSTYGCVLKALAKEGRVKEAIGVYHVILENGVTVKDSCYHAFVNALCDQEYSYAYPYPSKEVSKLVGEIIGKGYSPCGSKLSKFINALCTKKHGWMEADHVVNMVIEKGGVLLPDSFSYCALMKHYCYCRSSSKRQLMDSAIALHEKMKKVKGASLDVATYNLLLNGLFREKRIEDAISVFDCMRSQNLLSSTSFTIMISGLCRQNQLRMAMKFHDEMLNKELKPDPLTYKRIISGFK